MQNAGLDESQYRIKIARRKINNFRHADETTLMAKSEEWPKSLLMRVKEQSEKNWLKTQHSENEDHGIWFYHFMANRWGKYGNCQISFFLGSKITADSDYSHEIQRCLLGSKAMKNLDSIFKSRDITLLTTVHLAKAMVFFSNHVWMWEVDHKQASCQRIDEHYTILLRMLLIILND